MVLNFRSVRGSENRAKARFVKDVFFEICLEGSEYSLFLIINQIGRYRLEAPLLMIKSKSEDEILERWSMLLLQKNSISKILQENLNKFIVDEEIDQLASDSF